MYTELSSYAAADRIRGSKELVTNESMIPPVVSFSVELLTNRQEYTVTSCRIKTLFDSPPKIHPRVTVITMPTYTPRYSNMCGCARASVPNLDVICYPIFMSRTYSGKSCLIGKTWCLRFTDNLVILYLKEVSEVEWNDSRCFLLQDSWDRIDRCLFCKSDDKGRNETGCECSIIEPRSSRVT